MILGLQVIAFVFALIMIYFAYLNFRRGEINILEIFCWFIAWIGAILVVVFPSIFGQFAEKIAISRAFDLAVIGGFILLTPIVYISYIKTKKLEKKLEQYVREEALRGEVKAKNKDQ